MDRQAANTSRKPNEFIRKAAQSHNEKHGFGKIIGHAAEGYSFGPQGEENAWIKHSQMFSAEAQKALTTETRGQNSWVNFGTHNYDSAGNHKNIPLKDRPFASQKVALLPTELMDFRAVYELNLKLPPLQNW